MLTLNQHELVFAFPEVHTRARLIISFHRTLRLPDDNREYPLPPGLGSFPLSHVDDYANRLPPKWVEHGGILFPMAQAEAMWISFSSTYPFAVKVAAGKVNAVSGQPWTAELQERKAGSEQDYVTTPKQPWLDGFNVGKDVVRQFVAMPLGAGYTAEAQVTGEEVHGGLQIIAMPLKAEFYEDPDDILRYASYASSAVFSLERAPALDMGLAPGGLMKQKIYRDDFGVEKWDQQHSSRCFVHLLNSAQYEAVTGQQPPRDVPTAADYAKAGLPWFEIYDEDKASVPASAALSGLDSVAALGVKKGADPLPENAPLSGAPAVKKIAAVREGTF
ncbi:hypothetical protein AWB78_02423 [Caballeronia calidae]|uniref:Integral membrane protein n=1 Tax=Caballeronia calidae TaxID=1777139 RepID=A0A158B935_9BURK|nr:hypothetical protein [Caballeronia calidae]SAK66584.1 hypothetical protein AWB78_02423 [Caballeronia calidae]